MIAICDNNPNEKTVHFALCTWCLRFVIFFKQDHQQPLATVKAGPGQHLSSTVHLFTSIWPTVCLGGDKDKLPRVCVCESGTYFSLSLSLPVCLARSLCLSRSLSLSPPSPLNGHLHFLSSLAVVTVPSCKDGKTQDRHICHPMPAALCSEYAERP